MRAAEQARNVIRDAVRNALAFEAFSADDVHELRAVARQAAAGVGARLTSREADRIIREVTA